MSVASNEGQQGKYGTSLCTEVLRWDFIFPLPNFTHSWSRDFTRTLFFEPETSHVPGPSPVERNLSPLYCTVVFPAVHGADGDLAVVGIFPFRCTWQALGPEPSREEKGQETQTRSPAQARLLTGDREEKGPQAVMSDAGWLGSLEGGGERHQARPGLLDCAHSLPGWASQILSAKRLSPLSFLLFGCLGALSHCVCVLSLSTLSTKKACQWVHVYFVGLCVRVCACERAPLLRGDPLFLVALRFPLGSSPT